MRATGATGRTDRCGEAVLLTGEGDSVDAVPAGTVRVPRQLWVEPPGVQVEVHQPVAEAVRQPGPQTRRLRGHQSAQILSVVAVTGLELQRREGLVLPGCGAGEQVAEHEVGDVADGQITQVHVGAGRDPGPVAPGAQQLRDPDRVRETATATRAVDVDQQWYAADAARASKARQGVDVPAEVVPREPHQILGHDKTGRPRWSLQVGHDGVRCELGMPITPPGDGEPVQEVGCDALVQDRRVRDPGQHADLVVELDSDDRATIGLQSTGQHRQHGVVPLLDLGQKHRGQVVEISRRQRSSVPGGRAEAGQVHHPVWQTLVLELSHHVRPRSRDHVQPQLVGEIAERSQVTPVGGPAGDVDRAVRQLVDDPGDVGRHRLGSRRTQIQEP